MRNASRGHVPGPEHLSITILVTQVANAVVIRDHTLVLAFHDLPHRVRQAAPQGLGVFRFGVVLAALALLEYCLGVARAGRSFQTDPAAVYHALDAPAVVGVPSDLADQILQLLDGRAAGLLAFVENAAVWSTTCFLFNLRAGSKPTS